MYLTSKLLTLQIGVKCCRLITGFWPLLSPIIPAYVCIEVVGNGSLQAMGQAHQKWSSLEWSQGWLWSTGTLSLCRASCLDEGDRLRRSGCERTAPSPGERRQEGEDTLGPIWSGSTGFACLKVALFLDTVGTDGSSVSAIADFFFYMVVRFLYNFLLLKSGSIPNSSNVINPVWECQSLLSFTGKIAKEALSEPQPGSSPREGRPGVVRRSPLCRWSSNGIYSDKIAGVEKCGTDSMLEVTQREESRSTPHVGGITK